MKIKDLLKRLAVLMVILIIEFVWKLFLSLMLLDVISLYKIPYLKEFSKLQLFVTLIILDLIVALYTKTTSLGNIGLKKYVSDLAEFAISITIVIILLKIINYLL